MIVTKKGLHVARHMLPEIGGSREDSYSFKLPVGWCCRSFLCGCSVTYWPGKPGSVKKCAEHAALSDEQWKAERW